MCLVLLAILAYVKNGALETTAFLNPLKLGESAVGAFKMFGSSGWRTDNRKTTNLKLFSKFRSIVTCWKC